MQSQLFIRKWQPTHIPRNILDNARWMTSTSVKLPQEEWIQTKHSQSSEHAWCYGSDHIDWLSMIATVLKSQPRSHLPLSSTRLPSSFHRIRSNTFFESFACFQLEKYSDKWALLKQKKKPAEDTLSSSQQTWEIFANQSVWKCIRAFVSIKVMMKNIPDKLEICAAHSALLPGNAS